MQSILYSKNECFAFTIRAHYYETVMYNVIRKTYEYCTFHTCAISLQTVKDSIR